jgi:hypothetical protein
MFMVFYPFEVLVSGNISYWVFEGGSMFSSGKMIFSSHGEEFGTPPGQPRNFTGYGMVRAVRLEWRALVGASGVSYVLQTWCPVRGARLRCPDHI